MNVHTAGDFDMVVARRGLAAPSAAAAIDPFSYAPARWHWFEYVRTALVACWLAPLRISLILLGVLSAAVVGTCATIGAAADGPPSALQRTFLQPLRIFARIVLWGAGFWTVSIERPHNRRGKAAGLRGAQTPRIFVAAPHFSYLDPLVLMYAELPCQVSMQALRSWPLVGRVAAAMSTIFVERSDAVSRAEARRTIRERATQPGWPAVLVFPEGTTTNGTALIRFRSGAFEPGLPVQPVLLRYRRVLRRVASSTRHSPPPLSPCTHCRRSPLVGACSRYPVDLNGAGPWGGLWPVFIAPLLWSNSVRLTYMEPYWPSEQEQRDPELFARNVRAAMAEALRVPVVG